MRHIFAPSPGFSLDGILKPELESEAEAAPSVEAEAPLKATPEPQPDQSFDLLESAVHTSPQTLARFFELWTLRTQRSDARLIQAKALLYCALPYRRTRERSITRSVRLGRTRRVTITLAATEDGVELPYGSDRTLLAWLQTRGYERGVVELSAIQEYFRAFGLRSGGREYRALREALRRLEGLSIHLERGQGLETHHRLYMPFARPHRDRGRGGGVPSARRNPNGSGRPRFVVPLDPDFWHYLQADPVALPLDLLRAFRHRPKAWDLVAFVLHRCTIAKTPSIVPWPDLVEQLGTLDQCPRRLRRTLARVLDEIRVVHPRFPARFERGGGLLVGPWG